MEDQLQSIIRERNSLIHDLEAHWNIATHLPQPFSFTGRLKQWLQYRLTGSLTTHLNQIANQQRSFNATVVNLAYRLSSASDEQIRRTDERFHSLRNEMLLFQQQAAAHLASLTQQLTELKPLLEVTRQEQIALRTEVQALRTEVQALRTEVQALRTEVQALRTEVQIAYDTLPPLHQHIIDLESRLLDVDEALSEVAYRLSDSSTTKPT
jgi:chromosome segregation ATPase